MASRCARLDDSMAKISNDVTVDIRDGLEHQGQYLKSLVSIYSEHAVLVQKAIEFISQPHGRVSPGAMAQRGLKPARKN